MEQKNYNFELSFWLSSQIDEKEIEQKFNDLIKQMESLGGVIIFTQLPQLKPLAYPVKKEKNAYFNAYFGYIQFSFPKDFLNNLKEKLKLDSGIIRFLIVRMKAREKPQVFSPAAKRPLLRRQISKKEGRREKILPAGEEKEISLEELDKKLKEILKE